jgi:hypothetical protein
MRGIEDFTLKELYVRGLKIHGISELFLLLYLIPYK